MLVLLPLLVQAWRRAGAHVTFAVQSERFVAPVQKLAAEWDPASFAILCCDVTSDAQLDAAFASLAAHPLHAVLHSVAHAPKESLGSGIAAVSRGDFHAALDVSVYSLLAIAARSRPLMTAGGSITTMTFVGGDRVVPEYGVMGPAKACLQACAKYLAADLVSAAALYRVHA
jgi:enoyl-[acyl-carrier protein] reductase I